MLEITHENIRTFVARPNRIMKVYPASKLSRAPLWREAERLYPNLFLTARWLRHVEIGTPDSPENARDFWPEDFDDIRSSDAVFVWAEGEEHLRGALVEAGYAIAHSIPVYVIGEHRDYGTWQYHPMVQRVSSIGEALLDLLETSCEQEIRDIRAEGHL